MSTTDANQEPEEQPTDKPTKRRYPPTLARVVDTNPVPVEIVPAKMSGRRAERGRS